jgi:hypothetical protein
MKRQEEKDRRIFQTFRAALELKLAPTLSCPEHYHTETHHPPRGKKSAPMMRHFSIAMLKEAIH